MAKCCWPSAGGGSGADELVKVTAADTTAGTLAGVTPKIAAGSNVSLAVLNPGANEQLQISATTGGSVNANAFGYNNTQQNLTYPIFPTWIGFAGLTNWQAGPVSIHSITNGRITIGRDGRNAVQFSISFDNVSSTHNIEYRLVSNGIEIPGSRNAYESQNASNPRHEVTIFAIDDFSAGDIIEAEVRTTNGGSASFTVVYAKIESFELTPVSTGSIPYGEVNATGYTSPAIVQNAWYPIDPWVGAESNLDTVGVAGITISSDGAREVCLSMSFSGPANSNTEIAILLNGSPVTDSIKQRVLGTTGDTGNAGTVQIVNCAAGDLLSAAIRRTDANGGTFSVQSASLIEHELAGPAGSDQITYQVDNHQAPDFALSENTATDPVLVNISSDGPLGDDLIYFRAIRFTDDESAAYVTGIVPPDWNGSDPFVQIDAYQNSGSIGGLQQFQVSLLFVPDGQTLYPTADWSTFQQLYDFSFATNAVRDTVSHTLTPHVNGGGGAAAGQRYYLRLQYDGSTGSADPVEILGAAVKWPVS